MVAIFPNVCLRRHSLCSNLAGFDPEKLYRGTFISAMLLHRMAPVSFRLFCKNLGNLQEFFGQMVYRPGRKLPVRLWDRLTFLNRHVIVSIGWDC